MLCDIQDADLELSEEGLVEVREHKATISVKKEKDEIKEQENGTASIKDDDVVDTVTTDIQTDEPDMKPEQEGEPDDDKNDSNENDETNN